VTAFEMMGAESDTTFKKGIIEIFGE